MQITIDTRDSEEDIKKAISILKRLLEERQDSAENEPLSEQDMPKIQIVPALPKSEKSQHAKVLSELLDKKEEGRKKDEAFDVGEIIPY